MKFSAMVSIYSFVSYQLDFSFYVKNDVYNVDPVPNDNSIYSKFHTYCEL